MSSSRLNFEKIYLRINLSEYRCPFQGTDHLHILLAVLRELYPESDLEKEIEAASPFFHTEISRGTVLNKSDEFKESITMLWELKY